MLVLLRAIFNPLAFWFAHLKSELKSKPEIEKALQMHCIYKPPDSGKKDRSDMRQLSDQNKRQCHAPDQ